jgi:glycosyltransferase involved in cell wall biosynthesis
MKPESKTELVGNSRPELDQTCAPETAIDISVIIPTQNRANSLRITLECLASANRDGIRVEIIVVDNAGQDNTKEVVDSFSGHVPIRYLYEPKLGTFGKSHALNRALDADGLGGIIAVLDDDMSPDPNWFQGVIATCKRWPNKDIFTGHTYIIWPYDDVPEWAKRGKIHSKLFSAGYLSDSDSELEEGRWYLGGHFWFRSRVLQTGKRFRDIWVTEPDFQLDLAEIGFFGVASRDAVAGHRIQPALLQMDVALSRARKTGACLAWLNLRPYRRKVKQARLLHEHPWLGRLFCLLNHWRWRFLYLISYLYPSDGGRFEHRWIAVERMTLYLEFFRAANRLEDYSLWKRAPKMARNGSPV